MITLERDRLTFRFPDVHADAECSISFQRTLRIPDDNREHPLPPGLGKFPLRHVDDYANRVPPAWRKHGGVFMPMHQSEAMWLCFHASYPMAIKVAAGKINAITGEAWSNKLDTEPQDYLVVPGQPWLDGFCVAKGTIRQFVAMPLGEGYTAEEQLTGEGVYGGLQIMAYPMRADVYQKWMRRKRQSALASAFEVETPSFKLGLVEDVSDMGLAPGGLMRQEVHEDEHGINAWSREPSRCFVHLLNSVGYFAVTGAEPPEKPPTAADYSNAGLPWFDYYGGDKAALEGAKDLAGLQSVAAKRWQKGEGALPGNEPATPTVIQELGEREVRDNSW